MIRVMLMILFYSQIQRLIAEVHKNKLCSYSYNGTLFKYKSSHNYQEMIDSLWVRINKSGGLDVDDLPYDFDKEIKESLINIRDKDVLLPLIKSHDINIIVTDYPHNTPDKNTYSINEIRISYDLLFSEDKNKISSFLHSRLLNIYNELNVSCHVSNNNLRV